MKNELLEKLASDVIGDGNEHDLFFVSFDKKGVVLVTPEFEIAYEYWVKLTCYHAESALENRTWGIICAVSPNEETGRLEKIDDSRIFQQRKSYP